ncbi:MAG: hypothetical protein H0Z38_01825 [Firmicutes bacterium]|nr:hypothetical protein [Bacillota bacterium]
MPKRTKQVIYGALAFLVVGGLLFAGDHLYQTTQVTQPVLSEVSAIPGIRDVLLDKADGGLRLKLAFEPEANLSTTWPKLIQVLKRIPGGPGTVTVEIMNSAGSERLTEAYSSLQFALQESLATGSYTIIPETLRQLEKDYGIDGQAYLYDNYLLIVLDDSEGEFYKVVTLPGSSGSQSNPG